MGKITSKTLLQGIESLDLVAPDTKKKKELEALVDAHLAEMELAFECPSCGKDIPDVPLCPYCAEVFEDDEEEAVEVETEVETEEAVEEDVEEGNPNELDQEEEAVEEEEEEAAEEEEVEEEPKKKGKDKPNKPKEDKPKGRPAGTKSKSTEEKDKEFEALVEMIDGIVDNHFEKRERKTGITYVSGEKKRFLKAVSTGKTLSIEFNVEIDADDEDLQMFTPEEAKAKHLGSTRAIYRLGSIEVAEKLVKQAYDNL